MSVNEIWDFVFENDYKKLNSLSKTVIIQWNAWKIKYIIDWKHISKINSWSSQC